MHTTATYFEQSSDRDQCQYRQENTKMSENEEGCFNNRGFLICPGLQICHTPVWQILKLGRIRALNTGWSNSPWSVQSKKSSHYIESKIFLQWTDYRSRTVAGSEAQFKRGRLYGLNGMLGQVGSLASYQTIHDQIHRPFKLYMCRSQTPTSRARWQAYTILSWYSLRKSLSFTDYEESWLNTAR